NLATTLKKATRSFHTFLFDLTKIDCSFNYVLLFIYSISLILPAPAVSSSNSTCTSKNIQTCIEWANMASDDQQSYLKAVKCLTQLPAQTGIKGTVTRFDDMNAMHQVQAKIIHLVAQFLPFHRLYIYVYEQLLRDECGYKGPTPLWDESRDAGNFMDSPLLDPDTGFGANGTGPFANATLHIGPGQILSDHCLSRKVSEFNSTLGNKPMFRSAIVKPRTSISGRRPVTQPMALVTVESCIERSTNEYCGSGESWRISMQALESEDAESRLYQLGGPSTQRGTEELTLGYVMTTYEIRPNVTVKEVMDISAINKTTRRWNRDCNIPVH
ncbi:hypothetical protein LB506_008053, partial [Fusarium annulatum]